MSRGAWRQGLDEDLIPLIVAAIDQFEADDAYEKLGPKVADTVRALKELGSHAEGLLWSILKLSRVGSSALAEVSRGKSPYQSNRVHLEEVCRLLMALPRTAGPRDQYQLRIRLAAAAKNGQKLEVGLKTLADEAAAFIVRMHSPTLDSGQGSGSALGRESDLRATKIASALRSPKDKLAVAVIRACLRSGDPTYRSDKGGRRALKDLLDRIWRDIRPGSKATWKRVLDARATIFAIEAEAHLRRGQLQELRRNTSSRK